MSCFIHGPPSFYLFFAQLPVTCATNGIIAILISARLIQGHRLLSQLEGEFGSSNILHHRCPRAPYLTALAICVESSGIIVVATIISLILPSLFLPATILPQIYVRRQCYLVVKNSNFNVILFAITPALGCGTTFDHLSSHYPST